jgi:hypothetical protein
LRTRFGVSSTTAATGATTTTPGRNNAVSIAKARHNGRNTRPASGAAVNRATISGVSSTARS